MLVLVECKNRDGVPLGRLNSMKIGNSPHYYFKMAVRLMNTGVCRRIGRVVGMAWILACSGYLERLGGYGERGNKMSVERDTPVGEMA